jgi:hypothetical protein
MGNKPSRKAASCDSSRQFFVVLLVSNNSASNDGVTMQNLLPTGCPKTGRVVMVSSSLC